MKLSCCLSFLLLIDGGFCFFFGGFGFGYGITYQLYTRLNPVYGQPLTIYNDNTVAFSNFDKLKPTRLLIHGFAQNGRSTFNRDLKNGYLARGDFNVIVVDWSSVSSPYYLYARNAVSTTGIAVTKFLEWLNGNYSTLHVVGYDLGAHVAGIAGKYSTRGKINRILGLDPSRPYFNENASANRLSSGDATLVEVFHSNGGSLGIFQPIGDIDYYINKGKTQPECKTNINECSHFRSVATFSRLLNGQNNYVVNPCANIAEVETGCNSNPVEIKLEEILPSGIYQINTANAEAINSETELIAR